MKGRKKTFVFKFETPVLGNVGHGENKLTQQLLSRLEYGKACLQVIELLVIPLKGNIRFSRFYEYFSL